MTTTVIVPLGYGFVRRGLEYRCDEQGTSRISAAAAFARSKTNAVFGVFPGQVPYKPELNLSTLMEDEIFRQAGSYACIIKARDDGVWGSYGECEAAIDSVQESSADLVFVTSWYHVRRIELICHELLGDAYEDWVRFGKLLIIGTGTGSDPSYYSRMVEPAKRLIQHLMLRLGDFVPRTMRGAL